MFKTQKAILKGVEKFYLKEIAPLDDTLMIAAPFVLMKLRKFVENNAETMKDLKNDDGMFDVDTIIAQYKEIASSAPNGYMEVKGVKLYPKDFDTLKKLIEAEEN